MSGRMKKNVKFLTELHSFLSPSIQLHGIHWLDTRLKISFKIRNFFPSRHSIAHRITIIINYKLFSSTTNWCEMKLIHEILIRLPFNFKFMKCLVLIAIMMPCQWNEYNGKMSFTDEVRNV